MNNTSMKTNFYGILVALFFSFQAKAQLIQTNLPYTNDLTSGNTSVFTPLGNSSLLTNYIQLTPNQTSQAGGFC